RVSGSAEGGGPDGIGRRISGAAARATSGGTVAAGQLSETGWTCGSTIFAAAAIGTGLADDGGGGPAAAPRGGGGAGGGGGGRRARGAERRRRGHEGEVLGGLHRGGGPRRGGVPLDLLGPRLPHQQAQRQAQAVLPHAFHGKCSPGGCRRLHADTPGRPALGRSGSPAAVRRKGEAGCGIRGAPFRGRACAYL